MFAKTAKRESVRSSRAELKDTSRRLSLSVSRALRCARLDARRLQLEMTESLFAGDREAIVPTLVALRDMGVGTSTDSEPNVSSNRGAMMRATGFARCTPSNAVAL
jgi:predicted signal transduction protein with EAL and GGDEF domain